MNYISIKANDIANGPGIRTSLWVAGCPHFCKGCHNYEAWNPNAGKPFNSDALELLEYHMKIPFQKDLSILGGEPLAPYNVDRLTEVVKELKGKRPEMNIWLWSGYTYNEVKDFEIMNYIDVIVDGPYIQELHINNRLYGSSNQLIIDVKESRLRGETVKWKGEKQRSI